MVLPVFSVAAGIIGLFSGIILGSLLGTVGSLEILAFVLRIPIILIRSPEKLKSKWKIWRELRDARKIERLRKQKKIKELEEGIGGHRKQIEKIKAQVRRLKWELKGPD